MDLSKCIITKLDTYYELNPDTTRFDSSELENIIAACHVEENWLKVPGYPKFEANGVAGQVRLSDSKKIVGARNGRYFFITGAEICRGRLIRLTFDRDRKEHETLDHINNRRPFDDRLINTRWATPKDQVLNRRSWKRNRTKTYVTSKDPSFQCLEDVAISAQDASEKYGYGELSIAAVAFQPDRRLAGLFWRVAKDSDLPGEQWVDVSAWREHLIKPGYRVSNMGRFRNSYGHVTVGSRRFDGYQNVQLRSKQSKTVQELLHRLVCTMFNGPAPSSIHTVDHINRIRHDNRSENLRWATSTEQKNNQTRHVCDTNTRFPLL